MLHVLLLLPLLGCDLAMPDMGGLFGAAEPTPTAPVKAPTRDLATQVADIRERLRAGKAADAAKAAEALLAAHPEEDAVWELLELAAIRGSLAGELVDRLSADQAIGGRVDRHQALRGVLAVEANRLGDAINAARALRSTAPGDAAAIFALATAKGAPAPDDLTPAEKALLAVQAGAPLNEEVAALPGWRVALVRAEARLARGDRAGAALEAAVAEAGGPRARGLGSLVRVRAAGSAEEAWAAAEPSARAAMEDGDALGVAAILDAVLPSALGGWKAGAVATTAAELRGKLAEAGNTEAAARVAAAEAEAALRAGMPMRARDAATVAAALPAVSVRATWTLALTSAALGRPADVDAAASTLAEPRATAARDLAKALRGQSPKLPSAGLDGADAALQALLGAGWLAEPDVAYAAAAVAAEPLAPDLAAWARLATRTGPIPLAEGAAPSLRAEHAARAWLTSGTPATLPADLPHPDTNGWNALFAGTPAAADSPGVAAWSRLRVSLDRVDATAAAKELGALSTVVPAWRSGPWAPVAVLDGPRPSDLDADAVRSARGPEPLPFAVVHHGWDARVRSSEQRWSRGIAPFPPASTPEQRAAVWDAAAAYRTGVVAWLMGHDVWPAAAATRLDEAEQAAGLVRFAPPSLSALRTTLDGDAIVSFRVVPSGVETLYVGEQKGKLALLPASLPRDTGAMLASLRAGEPVVAQGDRLRETVIDGAMDVLLGIGRYMVVGPAPVGLLPIAAMPEQADGLRFLASIRHVGYLPDLDAVLPPVAAVEPEIGMTLFALCADPVESLAVRRVYPDAQVLEGAAATVAAFRADAGKARFVHVGGFPVTPDGGFQLADGPLTLGDIAALPLVARGVLIGGGQDPAVIAGRIAAFRQAGATDVMVEGWSVESDLRGPILMHFWEGLNRRYSASRSLSEARTLALREVGEPSVPPASWGAYFVSGRP